MALTKVVLSPCLFELMSDNEPKTVELEHYEHILNLLTYLVKLNVEFDLYEDAPYYPDATKRPPITRYHYYNTSCSQLYAKIQKKISYENYVELTEYEAAEIETEYTFPKKSETKESFLRYITFLVQNSASYLLFIGKPNMNKPRPMIFSWSTGETTECMPIFSPEIDLSGQLHTVFPQESSLFPCSAYCTELNNHFLQNRDTGDRKSIIKQYAAEAASRNGYIYDQHLSMLNSKKQGNARIVYHRLIDNQASYLSVDLESGGFEVFDHDATHLGQFSFAGNRDKPPSPKDHKLYLK